MRFDEDGTLIMDAPVLADTPPVEPALEEKPIVDPAREPEPKTEEAPKVEEPVEPAEPELTPEEKALKEEVDRRLRESQERASDTTVAAAPFDDDGDFHFRLAGRKDPWVIPTSEDGLDLEHPTFISEHTPEAQEYIKQHGRPQWEAAERTYQEARVQYKTRMGEWGLRTEGPKADTAYLSGLDLAAKQTAVSLGADPKAIEEIIKPLAQERSSQILAALMNKYEQAGYSEKAAAGLARAEVYQAYGDNTFSELLAQAIATPAGYQKFITGIARLATSANRVKDPALGGDSDPSAAAAAAAAVRSAAAATSPQTVDPVTGNTYTEAEIAAAKAIGYRPGDPNFDNAVIALRKNGRV